MGAVIAADNLRVQQKGGELADSLLRNAEAKLQVGLFAPVAVIEARAEKARREEQSIVAKNNLDVAKAGLSLLLNSNPGGGFLPRRVEAIDAPAFEETPLDRQKSLEQAMLQRPELQSTALNIRNRELQLRFAENQLLPRLDFRVGAGLTGIAGDLKPGTALRALTDYNNALAKLKLAEGGLLEAYNVKIEGLKKEANPWWAKF